MFKKHKCTNNLQEREWNHISQMANPPSTFHEGK